METLKDVLDTAGIISFFAVFIGLALDVIQPEKLLGLVGSRWYQPTLALALMVAGVGMLLHGETAVSQSHVLGMVGILGGLAWMTGSIMLLAGLKPWGHLTSDH